MELGAADTKERREGNPKSAPVVRVKQAHGRSSKEHTLRHGRGPGPGHASDAALRHGPGGPVRGLGRTRLAGADHLGSRSKKKLVLESFRGFSQLKMLVF